MSMIFKETADILTGLIFYVQGACFLCFLTQAFFVYRSSKKTLLSRKFVIMLLFLSFLNLKDTILLFDRYRSSMEVLHGVMLLDAFLVPLAGDFFFEFLWKDKWNESIAPKLLFIPSALIFLLYIIMPGFIMYRVGVIYTLILGLVIVFMTLYTTTNLYSGKNTDDKDSTIWVRLSLFSILFILLLWTVLFWDDDYLGKLAINPMLIILSFIIKRMTRSSSLMHSMDSSDKDAQQSEINVPVIDLKPAYVTTDELAVKIDRTIYQEKLYLDHKFNLSDWALKLGTNRTYLSEYINRVFETNFYDFVNKLRIEEAKRLFGQGEFRSIEEVSQACGYSSISTFNRNFSKLVGMTPSSYIKTLPQ